MAVTDQGSADPIASRKRDPIEPEPLLPDNLVANLFAIPGRTLVWSVDTKDLGLAPGPRAGRRRKSHQHVGDI
jgi:hypothetical protein